MAARILNRRALREQADQVQASEAVAPNTALVAVPPKKLSKAKAPAVPKVKKRRKEGTAPPPRPLGRLRCVHETGRDLRL